MPPLSIYLLGSFHATLGDAPVADLGYDHVRALLAYLAVEADRPHRREALAGLLWPDQDDRGALQNLRHALYRLQRAIANRQAEPPFVLVTREALQFNARSDHTLDVSRFQALVADGEAGDRLQRLEQAVTLSRGPFLQSFSLRASYPLEEWLLQKREQLDRRTAMALRELTVAYGGRGEYARAEQYARRTLTLDPWDEDTHRQLMRLLALDGRRGAALAQYHTLREMLRDELGVEPEPESIDLHARISGGHIGPPPSPRGPTPAPRQGSDAPPAAPCVGREEELRRMSACLDEALAGHGRMFLVGGGAGCGKTTLMAEFARRALSAHPQLVVACGSGSAQGGIGDPYLPFREVLQALCGDVSTPLCDGSVPHVYVDRQWAVAPVAIQALVEVGRDLIHRLVAAGPLALRTEALAHQMPHRFDRGRLLARVRELVAPSSPAGAADALPPQTDIFAQVTHVLQAIARVQPLLLILDDLQWADVGTISLLFHLGRRLEGHRIAIVGAYRKDEVSDERNGQRHPLAAVVNEFRRSWDNCEVDLERAEGRDFIAALLESERSRVGAGFCETLYRHTAGHALFTVELLRGLRERGDLRRDSDRFWVEGPNLNWEAVPPRVEGAIGERIARLPEDLRTILTAACVEGATFHAEVVARVCDMPERRVLGLLSRDLGARLGLVRAEGLSQPGGRPLSRYRFRHQLFQQYLYGRLDAVERARLHGAVLAALEALHEAGAEAPVGVLAHHAEIACLADRAASYWLRAGQRALALSAHDEAVALYRRSLTALRALPDSPERARRELEVQLALTAPLFVVRGWGAPERAEAADQAYRLAQRLGESERHLPLLLMLVNLKIGRMECRQALALAQQLLPLAEASGHALYVAAAHQVLGLSLVILAELRAALAHFRQGVAIYPGRTADEASLMPGLGSDLEVGLGLWLSYDLGLLGYLDQARECSRQTLRTAELLGHPASLAGALAFGCAVEGTLGGDIAAALDYSGRLLRLAEEKGLLSVRSWALIYQSWAQAMSGRADDAVPRLRAGLEALRQTGTLATQPQMQVLLAGACLRAGQTDAGLAAVETALSEAERTGAHCSTAELLRLRGELLLRAGRPGADDAAAECFIQALALARRQEAHLWELRAATSLACLRRRQGRPAEAHDALAEALDWFTEGLDTPDLQEARRMLPPAARG